MTPFTGFCKKGQILKIPIAHGEGNYFIDEKGLKDLMANNQIVLRYCSHDGEVNEQYNPNGSVDNIACICNKQGNVIGMMPHPERCVEEILGSSDGRFIFDSIIQSIKNKNEACRQGV
jgi:phosphoribosylformylglycinamidine synthase